MGSSDWAELPKHLWDSILKRLPSCSDYMQFSIVCKSWNSVAKDNLISKRIAPMLLTYSGKEETWNLCDITRDKVLDLQLELPKKRYFGFSKGWLITMDENFIVTLINPFSRVKGGRAKENSTIALPALDLSGISEELRTVYAEYLETYVKRATISADPISNAKDCIVVVIYGCLYELAFIRLDKDTTWTYIYQGVKNIHDVVYVQDKFFAISYVNNQLESFAVTPQFNPMEDVTTVARYCIQDDCMIKRYLVELSDRKELLMVHRYLDLKHRRCRRPGQRGQRVTTKFELFKFDADKYRWIRINSLGDVALFVGENSSISLLASEVLGCLPDCIYFIDDYDWVPREIHRDFGLYNIKTEDFLPIHNTQAATLIKMSNQTPIWTVASIKL